MFLFGQPNRISGNAASTKNIHSSVSEQLKKNFAKSRWRVRTSFHFLHFDLFFLFFFHVEFVILTALSFRLHTYYLLIRLTIHIHLSSSCLSLGLVFPYPHLKYSDCN